MVHGRRGQERRDRDLLGIEVPVGEDQDRRIPVSTACDGLGAEPIERRLQPGLALARGRRAIG